MWTAYFFLSFNRHHRPLWENVYNSQYCFSNALFQHGFKALRHTLYMTNTCASATVVTGALKHNLKHKSLTSPLWRALAVVGVYSIHTSSSIGTLMTGTVVYVVLTVGPVETWHKWKRETFTLSLCVQWRGHAPKCNSCGIIFSGVHNMTCRGSV